MLAAAAFLPWGLSRILPLLPPPGSFGRSSVVALIGLDGKLAYISSGDVIDIKTRKIVGQLKDEYGRPLHSEKLLDMLFEGGKLTRVANQFGNGLK